MSQLLEKIKVLRDLEKHKQALELSFQYLAEDPDNYIAYCEIILNMINLKQYKEALPFSEKLISMEPENCWAHYSYAYSLEKTRKMEKALYHIEEAISLNPWKPIYFEFIADLYCQWRNYEKALYYADQGLEIDPTNEHCLGCRLRCLTALDRKSELPDAIEHALQFGTDDFLTHFYICNAYRLMNNLPKAMEHLKVSLQLKVDFEDAQEVYKQLNDSLEKA